MKLIVFVSILLGGVVGANAGTVIDADVITTDILGVGVGKPIHPLDMGSGAHVTAAGVWVDASDRNLKKNIIDLESYGLDTVRMLRPRRYQMKSTGENQIGFIAQELKAVIPEIVSADGRVMGVAYGQMSVVLVKAIQELVEKNKELSKRLEALESK